MIKFKKNIEDLTKGTKVWPIFIANAQVRDIFSQVAKPGHTDVRRRGSIS
jgi:hypothetical protein